MGFLVRWGAERWPKKTDSRFSEFMGLGTFQEQLGTPVVSFCPFLFWSLLIKLNSRKKGTLIINGLLGNLGKREPLLFFGFGDSQLPIARCFPTKVDVDTLDFASHRPHQLPFKKVLSTGEGMQSLIGVYALLGGCLDLVSLLSNSGYRAYNRGYQG